MEIALSGFNPSLDSTAITETARQRQRQQQEAQQQSSAASRANNRSVQDQDTQSRTEASSRTPENARIINGEVLSSESSRVDSSQTYSSVLNRSSASQQVPNGQPDSRRVSVQQALQNFQENEELVITDSNPRQVSGIIDEFV